ncbi:hypothetical protein [Bradyrhizobium sp. USDA 3458]|uniref:hypothetical protein n=1 Tax=Bradyrhizobium sp. USDA 3458 TaxID=2591461 RepID=UPI001144A3EA|nr:hypothetical protein [Bradyrhizobium sp. USDA 3458]
MTSHKEKLKAHLLEYRVLGEDAALSDLDLACQAALHHMRNGDTMAIVRAEGLRDLPLIARPYYKKQLLAELSELGEFSVTVTMEHPLSDTLFISWV